MSYIAWNPTIRASHVWLVAAVLTQLIWVPSCTRTQNSQRTFASPEDAGSALAAAVKSGDQNGLIAIFGPDSQQVLFADDPSTNHIRLQEFLSAYGQMHRWRPINAGGQVLLVGADSYPFPIPLGQNSSGRWYFDTAAGKNEIQARRIGRNELTAMDAAHAIADAEQQYRQEAHDGNRVKEYAQQFVSDPGKHNGLYWPVAEGQPASPLGQMSDFTKVLNTAGDPNKPPSFNGYYYRILMRKSDTSNGANGKETAGFVILAYPSQYRDTGIMTFLIGDDGILYQKDLGERTADIVATMQEVDPRDGWTSTMTQTNTAARSE